MNNIIDLFTFIGIGVVIGLVLGVVINVIDGEAHPVVTGMIVGAVTGIAILLVPKRTQPPQL
ncbi:MAG: hypothetical protein AB7F65_12275 [Dehalococcoidia bacterium]